MQNFCEKYYLSANGNDTTCKRPAIGQVNLTVGEGSIPIHACGECAEDVQKMNETGEKIVRQRPKTDQKI